MNISPSCQCLTNADATMLIPEHPLKSPFIQTHGLLNAKCLSRVIMYGPTPMTP